MIEMKEIYQPARLGQNSQNEKVTQRLGYLPNDSVDCLLYTSHLLYNCF